MPQNQSQITYLQYVMFSKHYKIRMLKLKQLESQGV